MASFNKVILVGNLTRDPELRYTPKGSSVCDIVIAINRQWANDAGEKMSETTFVDVTLWGRVGEIVAQYCTKGSPLMVEGRLQTESWEDKATMQKRTKLKVVGENIQLMGDKRESSPAPGSDGRPAQQPRPAPTGQRAPMPANTRQQTPPPADDPPWPEDDGSGMPF